MITEDYVSFETAKLLKEKGFDWCCGNSYLNEKGVILFPKPTLQMTMKWLREKFGIILVIAPNLDEDYNVIEGYCCMIYKDKHLVTTLCDEVYTYEQAGDEGIKYALENLI